MYVCNSFCMQGMEGGVYDLVESLDNWSSTLRTLVAKLSSSPRCYLLIKVRIHFVRRKVVNYLTIGFFFGKGGGLVPSKLPFYVPIVLLILS